ncbi:MAG TPA: sugar kinase [Thermomicrobiaceae bacterium]|nr:sugar kinase [Thermomicrobiaceae bacterium]
MVAPNRQFDLVTFGETMIRLSTSLGTRLETTPALHVGIGGAESNVAVALARLGRSTSWQSVLPNNSLGQRVAGELRHHGVDTSNVRWVSERDGKVGVYYLDTGAPPRPTQVIYDRAGSAISRCDPDTIDPSFVSTGRLLHLTGITPALSSTCAAICRRLVDVATANEIPISFDINYRALLWPPEQAGRELEPFCRAATILICGRADGKRLFGLDGSDVEMVRQLADRFDSPITLLTTGEEGATALVRNPSGDGQLIQEPATATQVVDKVGAGDAFAAGFIHGYLDGDVSLAVRLAVRLAALKMTIQGDLAVLTQAEIEDCLADAGDGPRHRVLR